jgi:hypothetical protein
LFIAAGGFKFLKMLFSVVIFEARLICLFLKIKKKSLIKTKLNYQAALHTHPFYTMESSKHPLSQSHNNETFKTEQEKIIFLQE